MPGSEKLSLAEAVDFDTFVAPRYLARYADLALEMLVSGPEARILHAGCRSGYPDLVLYERIERAEILGTDASEAALDIARSRLAQLSEPRIAYRPLEALPGELEPGFFTHALSLHPVLGPAERPALWSALRGLLCAGGQALVALPLRSSFTELLDLLREYALKYDDADFARELEERVGRTLTLETFSEEFEAAGFDDVDVEIRNFALSFANGRAFFEDPAARLLILPELKKWLEKEDLSRAFVYVRDAIDKYWSEVPFELTVCVGCASARCP